MDFIAISLYHKVLNHALKEGISPNSIASMQLSEEASDSPQVVAADTFFELHEVVDQGLKPGFSVRVGQEMVLDDYGVLGLSWKTCSKAREIFERSERYFKLLTNTYVFKIEDEQQVSNIHLFRLAYRRGVELSNEATFSATVKVLRDMTETTISPILVAFKHGPPSNTSDHQAWFNCPVLFNQESNFISYRKSDLDTRTAKADRSINQFLLQRIEEEAKDMKLNPGKLVVEVKNLIRDALPSGIPNKDKVGRHIGLSNRTLSRRLAEYGITFRELIEETQQEISKELLHKTSQTISEIAFQTGFSEQSAFNRAFKRWTGQSPTSFRK